MSVRLLCRCLLGCGLWAVLLGPSVSWGVCAEPSSPPATGANVDLDDALNAKVETALDKRGDWEFVDTPLDDVAAYLSDVAAAPVLLDAKSLADLGVETSTPVTISLKGVRLRSLLAHLVRPLQLAWDVREGAVWITSPEADEARPTVVVYPVADFVRTGAAAEERDDAYAELVEVVTSVIAPTSWDAVGGPGSIEGIHGTLTVRQTYDVHRHVGGLLRNLRQLAEVGRQRPDALPPPIAVEPVADSARVREALERPITLEFIDTPLRDAADYIADRCAMPVLMDVHALNDIGLEPDKPVTVNVKDVPLRIALRRILEKLDLTYVVRDEALVLTTPEQSETRLLAVCYPVFDLVTAARDGEWLSDVGLGYDALIQTITSTVLPDSWDAVGGPASVATLSAPPTLIVQQTEDGHRQIQKLLRDLRAAKTAQGAAGPKPPASEPARLEIYRLKIDPKVRPPITPDQVVTLIRTVVEPQSWTLDQNALVTCAGNQLVVRHTPAVHRKIARLLDKLDVREKAPFGMIGIEGSGMFDVAESPVSWCAGVRSANLASPTEARMGGVSERQ